MGYFRKNCRGMTYFSLKFIISQIIKLKVLRYSKTNQFLSLPPSSRKFKKKDLFFHSIETDL